MSLHVCLTKQPPLHEVLRSARDMKKLSKVEYHKLHAAFLKGKQWDQNQTIRIAFFKEGFTYAGQYYNSRDETDNSSTPDDPDLIRNTNQYTDDRADFVRQTVENKLVPLVNLNLEWDVDLQNSDIRISFVPNLGSWSYIGNDNLTIDPTQPTMNLGWLDNDVDYDAPIYEGTGIVVIHEFGHMLGMIHEHSRADSNLQWNKPFVYKALGGPPNNWSKKEVDQQVFDAIPVESFNGSKYDPSSVMHYIFPSNWFLVDPHLPVVTKLSPLDIQWISKTYPKNSLQMRGGEIGSTNPKPKDVNYLLFFVVLLFLMALKYMFEINNVLLLGAFLVFVILYSIDKKCPKIY